LAGVFWRRTLIKKHPAQIIEKMQQSLLLLWLFDQVFSIKKALHPFFEALWVVGTIINQYSSHLPRLLPAQ
jgi:hypothetical protein